MNRTLLPPSSVMRRLAPKIDERGIPVPEWWTDDERDSTFVANALLSRNMRVGQPVR